DGGVYNDKGLDIPGLLAHTAQGKPVPEWSGGKRITNEELWTIPCDWLVPAALGGVITKEANAQTVDCKVVVEGANEPTTPNAGEGTSLRPSFQVVSREPGRDPRPG